MKGTEIHNGLDKQEIRDFLSTSINNNQRSQSNIERKNVAEYTGIDSAIESTEYDIEYQQERLKYLKEFKTIFSMIELLNWDEYDVSNHTSIEKGEKYHRSFIGTVKEYENKIKQWEGENI